MCAMRALLIFEGGNFICQDQLTGLKPNHVPEYAMHAGS